jgi:hypothetical protein
MVNMRGQATLACRVRIASRAARPLGVTVISGVWGDDSGAGLDVGRHPGRETDVVYRILNQGAEVEVVVNAEGTAELQVLQLRIT